MEVMEVIKVKRTLLVDVTEETTSVASSARCAVPRPLHVRVVTMLHVTGSHARMQSLTVKTMIFAIPSSRNEQGRSEGDRHDAGGRVRQRVDHLARGKTPYTHGAVLVSAKRGRKRRKQCNTESFVSHRRSRSNDVIEESDAADGVLMPCR
jgi:hypothetical protein